jgi:hypothetical protein
LEKQSIDTWERIRQGLYPVDPFTRMTPEMWEVLEKAQKRASEPFYDPDAMEALL